MRSIPAVHRFLSEPRIAAFEAILGKASVKGSIVQTLDAARRQSRDGGVPAYETLRESVIERLEREHGEMLVSVINATGVLLHTNLGRAPLSKAAVEAMAKIAAGYSNVEYRLATGRRGSRYAHATGILRALTGAQDALVVNNGAAAVLLVLDTLAKGREVIVSRGQLVEIGGGFRLPDVLERSGARLVEVGTTNKTYLRDFERALSPHTALLLRTHPSNFRMTGFTQDLDPAQLGALGRRAGIPVVEDLGSGALADFGEYGLPRERTVRQALADGMDLVTFSGDKMLGGPQAGIIAGNGALIARLLANPLLRALRVDKITLAALAETLALHASPKRRCELPLFAMLEASVEQLRSRARGYCDAVPGAEAIDSAAYAGGGSLPESAIASVAIAVPFAAGAQRAAAALRRQPTPIVARIDDDRVLLDLRTISS